MAAEATCVISVVEAFNRINPEVLNSCGQFWDGFLAFDCSFEESVSRAEVLPAKLRSTCQTDGAESQKVIPGCLVLREEGLANVRFDNGALGGPETEEGWRRVLLFHPGNESDEITKRAVLGILDLKVVDGSEGDTEGAVSYPGWHPNVETVFLVDRPCFLHSYPWFSEPQIENVSSLNLGWRMPSIIPLKLDPRDGFKPIGVQASVAASFSLNYYSDGYINDRLFLCSRRAIETKKVFQRLDIDCVVDLSTHGGNILEVEGTNYLRLEIPDEAADDVAQRLMHDVIPTALEFITRKLAAGRNVVVHCDKGQSRSGAVLVAWEMISRQRNLRVAGHVSSESQESVANRDCVQLYDVALAAIRRYRPIVEPNPGFARAMQQLTLDDAACKKWENSFVQGMRQGNGADP
eukprot:TRINITY_DN122447_c0_g1_i1.p1 TRINITY_DN122447_c0_g1~~TRINITY_DN122447_c0_g1_i1.p1  ORF type:complete len:407 (+),score=29.45 TRINITY_DN122447_c0_g1_i1:68-1288(+)